MSQQTEFQLRGWPAVVVAICALCFFGAKVWYTKTSLPNEGRAALVDYYSMEYQRYQLAREDISLEEQTQLILAANDLEITSVSARGTNDVVVRVEIAPNAAQPPGTDNTRYCMVTHNVLSGWVPERDVPKWTYYTKMF